MRKKILYAAVAGALSAVSMPIAFASPAHQAISQGVSHYVLQNSHFFGPLDANAPITVDIVMKIQNKDRLIQLISSTVTPGSQNYRHYLTVDQFKAQFAPNESQVKAVTNYLSSFGITNVTVYPDNLIISAKGTAGQFNQAFNVRLKSASFNGKVYHAATENPSVPSSLANNILCVLGLSSYSNYVSHAHRQPSKDDNSVHPKASSNPTGKMTGDLVSLYNVQPLYNQGATGDHQTIGIVTLADFNASDAYSYWKYNNIQYKPNRITKLNIDGGSGLSESAGSDETTLDVQQSGALAPGARINVYVGPNSDTGFTDTFAKAINDNLAQQISVSWGQSESLINASVLANIETPEYAEVFNQLFMQAASQGISMFAAAGDSGAYDASRDLGTYNLSVDSPAHSPYITAAGGTTVPYTFTSSKYKISITVPQERAWGWDYLYPYFDKRGFNNPDGWAAHYFIGGGGGFSQFFPTPVYQQGISGVNAFTAVKMWSPSSDWTSVTRDSQATLLTGTGSGRNLPDLSMNADPRTGYSIYFNLPTGDPSSPGVDSGWVTAGGTSFVAPQLAGLSALINSTINSKTGFWNPQIYRYAASGNSPFHPLATSGSANDNIFYSGTPGTVYNQATGLGTPDVAKLANQFFAD